MKVKRKIQELYQTSDDSGIPTKLDSTLTPKLLTYSRKYKVKRRAPMVCVLTPFFDTCKEGDSCEGKAADLKETKRCTVLKSVDGVRPMDQRNMLRRC